MWLSQDVENTVRYVSYAGESLFQLAIFVRMIMALEDVAKISVHHCAPKSDALTTVYDKDHIGKNPAWVGGIVPDSVPTEDGPRPSKIGDGAHVAMWVIEACWQNKKPIISHSEVLKGASR